ncbi:OmpH family outer membrane protein [Croceiramulus getboli]|nr:OmpH family outer membrane protein [Flavobacteriaceae bacterium YJPT1-3]
MKTKVLFLLTVFISLLGNVHAQRSIRIGYIDMDYILENVPEYQDATQQLDQKVNAWKTEIEKKLSEIDRMKKTLDNERVLLTPELIEERQEEIAYEEAQILDYQQKRFGPGGDLMIQKRQLIEPVQDQVFNAVQQISENRKYDFVFDKSADLVMLYSNERFDISDEVLLSLNRASKRKQANNKQDRKEIVREEEKTVEQAQETQARQQAIEDKKKEREAYLADRKQTQDSIRAAKRAAFEKRRADLLAERQRKKDSVAAARGETVNPDTNAKASASAQSATDEQDADAKKKARQAELADRQRKKDSLMAAKRAARDAMLEERRRKRDSLIEARKKNTENTPPVIPEGDDGGN